MIGVEVGIAIGIDGVHRTSKHDPDTDADTESSGYCDTVSFAGMTARMSVLTQPLTIDQ